MLFVDVDCEADAKVTKLLTRLSHLQNSSSTCLLPLMFWPWPRSRSTSTLSPRARTYAKPHSRSQSLIANIILQVIIKWRGKPVFIRHRTESEIAEANKVEVSSLRDPQSDEDRVQQPEWLVMLGMSSRALTYLVSHPTNIT